MGKGLLLLLGVILIGLLSYLCFMSKASGIEKELISRTKSLYSDKDMEWIEVGIRGEKLEMTRILTLTGVAKTAEERVEAESVAKNVEGVMGVDNKITIKPIPTPYKIDVIKSKSGQVTLSGYVLDSDMHNKLIGRSKALFGEANVVDNLQEAYGSPVGWYESLDLGIEKLEMMDYGKIEIVDSSFKFEGFAGEKSTKDTVLESFENSLSSDYQGSYAIETPVIIEEVKEVAVETIEPETIDIVEEVPKEEIKTVACQEHFKDLLSKDKIYFEYDKADIKTESYKLLDKLISVANECPKSKIVIEGHTDSDGSERYNQQLSSKRANAVKNHLIEKGISAERLEAVGYGEVNPIATNDTNEGREKNRRIEFNVKEGVE